MEIYLLKMIESRSAEVSALNVECKTKQAKLASQRLPRHMRRRAASHNPKRVPKSVRQTIVNRLSDKRKAKANKKSKHKNKDKLKLSVKRRAAKKERSVLHVWFAKRFKMQMHWNYLLPINNTTKNQRSLYHSSKNDVTFYHISHVQCLQIDYSGSNKDTLISLLSHFTHSDIGCGFGAKLYQNENREGFTVLYNHDCYPFDVLSNCNFLWDHSNNHLSLWLHISVFNCFYDQMLSSIDKYAYDLKLLKTDLERLRLVGPKSYFLLSKCFNSELFNTLIHQNDKFIYYLRYDVLNSSITTSDSISFSKSILSSESPLKVIEFLLVINNLFNKRITTDLIVSKNGAKYLWNKLTQNRSHKAGGLRDLKMLALNTSSLFFPYTGFSDTSFNQNHLKPLKNNSTSDKPFYVIRSESIILSLMKNLESSQITKFNVLHKNNALINVEVVSVNRGVANELDLIVLPTENEFQYCCSDRDTRIIQQQSLNSLIEREIIGLIEFGAYSMEESRGKAIGVLTLNGLEKLLMLNEKVETKTNKRNIFALVKSSKSSNLNFITVKLINSVF